MPVLTPIARFKPTRPAAFGPTDVAARVAAVREPLHVVRDPGTGALGVASDGEPGDGPLELLATLPPLWPEWLGDRSFGEVHGVRFPYAAGAMANGIASVDLVVAMARSQLLAFFGAAGLSLERVEKSLDAIGQALEGTGATWGSNLIHSPNEPALEDAVADLYLRRGVRHVDASAFMALTPAIVRYACTGLSLDPAGAIQRTNHVFAKISRPEVARRFLSPAPPDVLQQLVEKGLLTRAEATLAAHVPLAEDVTVEADSGGHTDNRPLVALFPTIRALQDELSRQHGYARPIRVGAAGGLGTPAGVAAAFALGAAYVLTGTVNQAAVESGLSEDGKRMLAQADVADVIMAPAADMFEMGVKLQVLRRGTMFAVRAARLYDLYVAHPSMEAIPAELRARVEKEVFGTSLDAVWADTRAFFERRDPPQLERAERDPKHKLALVCRWYLGKSSRWAIEGDASRRLDYQVWCGPAMGAFNAWVKGSFLEPPAARGVVPIALNLLEGAAVVTRAQQLRTYGVPVPPAAFDFRPRPLALG
jgi:trans-AT polyketide synthase/acyltransferase/oxidoreductase domain-containing protein